MVQLNTIPKDLTLPAPVPIKPTPRYIFGDLSKRAYAPSNNWIPRVVEEYRGELRAEIEDFLNMDRDALKSKLALTFGYVLAKSSAEADSDLRAVFHDHLDLLTIELARGILHKQATSETWRPHLEKSKGRVPGIPPRKKYFKRRHCYANRILLSPSRLSRMK